MNIAELFILLGFKADTMKLKEFVSAVGSLNMSSVMSAVGLGVLYEGISKIMGIADSAGMGIWNFSQVTGIASKEVQQFSNYSEEMGATADEAKNSLANLQMSMAKVKLGEGNIRPFYMMGVDLNEKDIFKTMIQIQNFLKNSPMDATLKRMIVAEAGVAQGLIPVLENTKDLTAEMVKQGYINDQEIEKTREFHKVNRELGADMIILWTQIGAVLTPFVDGLTKISDLLLKITRTGKGWGNLFGTLGKDLWESTSFSMIGKAMSGGDTTNHIAIEVNGAQSPEATGHAINRVIQNSSRNFKGASR